MYRIVRVDSLEAIPATLAETAIGRLLEYHNLGRALPVYTTPEVVLGLCVDDRRRLRVPPGFALVVRTPGPTLADDDFRVAYALAVGGARAIAVVAHLDCGMSALAEHQERFAAGLVERAGWQPVEARRYVAEHTRRLDVRDPVDGALAEADRLRARFPRATVAALVHDGHAHRLAVVHAP